MRFGERPQMLAGAFLHDGVEPLRRRVALARLGFAQGELGQHRHAGLAVRANGLAVVEERHRRVSGKDDAVGFRPRHVQEIVQRAVDRFQPVVEGIELIAGLGEAVHVAEPAAQAAQDRLVGQHRVGDQPRKADVVAADRQEEQVDLARALGIALLEHQATLELGDGLVDVIGLGQVVVARALAAALRLGDGRDLRQVGRVRHPLVALVLEEQAERRLRPRAGDADERHGPVRVLDRELQRGSAAGGSRASGGRPGPASARSPR